MKVDMPLKKLQALELKIALEMKRICEKNSIPYFLVGGTLLGAVRHGGFIPWDDDMDIGMLRQDYERFIEACQTDLGEEFFLHNWDTDPEYPFSYTKIRLNDTHIAEHFVGDSLLKHDGISVDVFPFDNVPDNLKDRNRQAKKYFVCKRLLWIKKGMGITMKAGPLMQRMKYYAFFYMSKLFRYNSVKDYFKKVQTMYNDLITEKVVADGAYSYAKESIDRAWVMNLEPILFENEVFLSFVDKHAYLEHLYGDYMQLPPEDQRGGHGLLQVDFGPYTR